MKPKEKAEELLGKYLAIQFGDFPTTDAKQCALIAVDEILPLAWLDYPIAEYWLEVKQEIENYNTDTP